MRRRRLQPGAGELALGLLLSLGSQEAAAQRCPTPDAALQEQEGAARLRFLRDSLKESAAQEQRFLLGWSMTYAALAVAGPAQLVLPHGPRSADEERGVRVEILWGMSTSAAASLLVMLKPLPLMLAQRRDARNQGEVCALVAAAERELRRAAASQESARGALSHASSLLVSVGLGLVLAYGLGRPTAAGINTTVGVLLGELQIATRPRTAQRALARYRAADLRATPKAGAFSFSVAGAATPRFSVAGAAEALRLSIAPLPPGSGYGVALAGAF